ncbi:MAG: hypothetical protein BJ554DRAFT_1426 [Olpidium bornovanus]|uniref:Uncharacterized protein n=1 Tax=Olpidium bornovanus TaxID=278681 RepID=A0A8H7ZSF4_9FUNG|nr:MAG: hypothetical protein BJ554DRAFT_1426 [Olpidium bornovanus]
MQLGIFFSLPTPARPSSPLKVIPPSFFFSLFPCVTRGDYAASEKAAPEV